MRALSYLFSILIVFLCISFNGYSQELTTELNTGYKVGDYEVFVFAEGSGDAETGLLIDASADITAKYAPNGTFPITTNVVLIKRKGKVWLIDTGYGWKIFEHMKNLGVECQDVDQILLTHMHGDHVGGMLLDGNPVFVNSSIAVSDKELAYWSSEVEMNKFPPDQRGNFHTVQKIKEQYGTKVKTVQALALDGDYGDGIFPIEAYGHTPGHIMYLISDGGEKLLVWGDLTHALAIQMPHPEISITYDVDPDMARETRLKVLEYLADKDIAVIGMHVPVPQPGKIVKDEISGGYKFLSKLK